MDEEAAARYKPTGFKAIGRLNGAKAENTDRDFNFVDGEPVYIGGKEYTYPAIRKITYTETTDGVVTRQWAEQTAYPGLDEIINGTYVETFVPVDP